MATNYRSIKVSNGDILDRMLPRREDLGVAGDTGDDQVPEFLREAINNQVEEDIKGTTDCSDKQSGYECSTKPGCFWDGATCGSLDAQNDRNFVAADANSQAGSLYWALRNKYASQRPGYWYGRSRKPRFKSKSVRRHTKSKSGRRRTKLKSGRRRTKSKGGRRRTKSKSGSRHTKPKSSHRRTKSKSGRRRRSKF